MTKETIIDGCNVAECEHHYTNLVDGITYHGCSIYEQTNELGYQQDTLCEQNPDCYFKKLQRLKKELEIKEKQSEHFMIGSGEVLDKLRQENEEKEKNIDGIDVSECPLFDKKTGCYHTFDGECAKDSCALYKWLIEYKRLQEENEELKERLKNQCI